jgi:hypothetical protein
MRTLWPVLERELRVAARRPQTWRLRLAVAGAAMFFLLVMVWFFGRSGIQASSGQVGSAAFHAVTLLAGLWALFLGCQRTADSLGRERREGTLGLLFLTDLNGWSVTAGKLFAAGVDTVFQIVAVIPVLVVPVLLGGVSLGQLGMLLLALGNALFLSLVSGLLASLLSRDPRQATGLAAAWILALVFIPWGLFAYLTTRDNPFTAQEAGWVLLASPTVPFLGALSTASLPFPEVRLACLAAVALQGLVSLVLMWITADWVRVVWQEGGGPGWRQRWERLAAWFRYGGAERRKQSRRRWLGEGAWDWLSLRDVWKPWLPWVLVGAFILLQVFSIISVGVRGTFGAGSGIMSTIFHLLFTLWVAGEASITLSEQRIAGAFELLLTTGLGADEILAAQGRVLRRILLVPILVLMGYDLIVVLYLPTAQESWDSVVLGWWLHLTNLVLTPFYCGAVRWASTRAILAARPINLAVGLAMNSVYLMPGIIAYGVFGGLATVLVLDNRLTWSDGLFWAFLPPMVLLAGWCTWWGRRQSGWVRSEFRQAFTSRSNAVAHPGSG